MKNLTQAEISTLCNEMIGTCSVIDVYLEQFGARLEDLSPGTLSEIDHMMFQCAACGWWCEICEASTHEPEAGHEDEGYSLRETDELICKDCA